MKLSLAVVGVLLGRALGDVPTIATKVSKFFVELIESLTVSTRAPNSSTATMARNCEALDSRMANTDRFLATFAVLPISVCSSSLTALS